MRRWTLATALALPLGVTPMVALAIDGHSVWVVLLPGLALGVGQTLVLWRQSTRAIWWLPASALAFGAGLFLALLVAELALSVFAFPIVWVVYGLASGAALSWILKRR